MSSDVLMYQNLSNQLSKPTAAEPPPEEPPSRFDTFVDEMRMRRSTPPPSAVHAPSTAPPPSFGGVPSVAAAASPAGVTPPASVVSAESTMHDKHGLLLELHRLRQAGASLTREWTMQDDLESMQMEMRKVTSNMEEAQTVNMMRDMMRIGFAGVEFLNGRIGLLELDGWSEQMSQDIHKYDGALRKLYQKWWRRSSTSPEMEIIIGLGTSLLMHHAKNKLTGGTARAGRAAPRASSPKNDTPFTMPSVPADTDSDVEEAPPPMTNDPVRVEFM